MKRIAALLTAAAVFFAATGVYGFTDDFIEADPVSNTYTGRLEAYEMRFNLQFEDLYDFPWAVESIARNGALNLIKGFEDHFYPERIVTKLDAICHVMRALGYEAQVLQQASGIGVQLPSGVPTDMLVSLAYLNLASSIGLISKQQYNDALYEEEQRQQLFNSFGADAAKAFVLPDYMFDKNAPAPREDVAFWIYTGLLSLNKQIWTNPMSIQGVYMYNDWAEINASYLPAVEAMLINGIMNGYMGAFMPAEPINRATLAQILNNLNSIYYDVAGIQKKTGMVGGFIDSTGLDTAAFEYTRQILVRTADGMKDVLVFSGTVDSQSKTTAYDAIVYKDSAIQGLQALEEGDVIEYLVHPQTNTVLYVQVLGPGTEIEVRGILEAVDFQGKIVTLKEADSNMHDYTFASGMGYSDGDVNYFIMDNERIAAEYLPVGSMVSLKLIGNLVVSAHYIGEPVIIAESGGVVLENNPDFGYMDILTAEGYTVTKRYLENSMTVEKREYYETQPMLGYITDIFPYFGFNPRAATIDQIEAGDLVFFRTYENDPEIIESISAATNYTVKYGKIRSVKPGSRFTEVILEYENHQTGSYNIANGIFVTKDGRSARVADMVVGDWVKLLVNDAVLAPGKVAESVKEITVEGPEHYIGTIISGNISNIDDIQKKLIIENAQTLEKFGWSNYRNLDSFDISGNDIEYYVGSQRVSRDHLVRFYKRSSATVYIAMESTHLGDRVKVVTVRESRDTVLPWDYVTASSGGSFNVSVQPDAIRTDAGTIVVRDGRLVTGIDVYPGDYTRTVLNGAGQAAVVEVGDPTTLMFARGRVMAVDEGQNFTVRGMSVLAGTQWQYTPVERIFDIDYNTIFLDENGYLQPDTFIPYTEDTVLENYYTIVVDGSRAAFVVAAPYCTGSVMGKIVSADDGAIYLKEVQYLEPTTGVWKTVSSTNNSLWVNIYPNTVVGRNSDVIKATSLIPGETVMIMTPSLDGYGQITPETVLDGYIVISIK